MFGKMIKRKKISISLPPEIERKLRNRARLKFMTLSEYIRHVLRELWE